MAWPGTVALLAPGEPHTGEAAGSDGWSYVAAYLPPRLLGLGHPPGQRRGQRAPAKVVHAGLQELPWEWNPLGVADLAPDDEYD